MKVLSIELADLEACARNAQRQAVVLTRQGKPVALMVGVQGLDLEQLELGYSDKFWTLLRGWRKQKTMSQQEFDRRLQALDEEEAQAPARDAKAGSAGKAKKAIRGPS